MENLKDFRVYWKASYIFFFEWEKHFIQWSETKIIERLLSNSNTLLNHWMFLLFYKHSYNVTQSLMLSVLPFLVQRCIIVIRTNICNFTLRKLYLKSFTIVSSFWVNTQESLIQDGYIWECYIQIGIKVTMQICKFVISFVLFFLENKFKIPGKIISYRE